MKKRGVVFLESLGLSLALSLIFVTMTYCGYPTVFATSLCETTYPEQASENQQLDEYAGEDLQKVEVAGIISESRPIQNATRVNGKTLACLPAYFQVPRPTSTQTFIQCLPRASPLP